MFADAEIDIAALAVGGIEDTQIGRLGVVRSGQVGRAADGFAHNRVHRFQHDFTGAARGDLRQLFHGRFLHGPEGGRKLCRHVTRENPGKFGLLSCGQGGKPRLPLFARRHATGTDRLPRRLDVSRNDEGRMRPAIGGLGISHQLGIGQCAMPLGGILRRRPKRDMRAAIHQRRLPRRLCRRDRAVDVHRIMAVTGEHRPARGSKARFLIGHVGKRNLAVDGNAVVVPQHDQTRQFQLAGQRQRFLADTFHQAAVPGDDIGEMINHPGPPAGAQRFLGNGKADGIGQPLAQRAGGGLNALGMAELRVACRDRPPLAEIADLPDGHVGRTGQVQQCIKQHRAMPGGQDETVAVRPIGGRGVKAQVPLEQHGRHIGHAHRHAGMARVGSGHTIQGQRTDRAGFHPVVGVLGAQGRYVQGQVSFGRGPFGPDENCLGG